MRAGSLYKPSGRQGWASDRTATLMSNLCILHCIALPLAAALPAGLVAGGLYGPHWLHWAMLLVAFPISYLALRKGFRLHGRKLPWTVALTGFAVMAVGALLHGSGLVEAALTVAGGLLIGVAHWRNRAAALLA